jgi:hypothetical protein
MGKNDFILGAQWYSTDEGLTWQRVPPKTDPSDVTMTVVKVDHDRGEITVQTDLRRVFGVRTAVVHALAPDNRGAIKAMAACGEIVAGPLGPSPTAVPFEQRAHATCHICRAS